MTLKWIGASKFDHHVRQFFEPHPMIFKEVKEKKKRSSSHCYFSAKKKTLKYLNAILYEKGGGCRVINYLRIIAFRGGS